MAGRCISGGGYALASLSCTIAPFLAIAVTGFRAESFVGGIALFASYALGMGFVVGVAAVAVALTKTTMLSRLRRLGGAVGRVGGAIVGVAGAYVAYYGWYEIRIPARSAACSSSCSGWSKRMYAPLYALCRIVLLHRTIWSSE